MCKFCEGQEPIYKLRLDEVRVSKSSVDGKPCLDITQGGLNLLVSIRHCPMCRRKL